MEFDKKVLETLQSTIRKNRLQIEFPFKNCIELSSDHLLIRIVRNDREYANNLWIKPLTVNGETVEIDDYVMKHHFNSELKISNVPVDEFISNVKEFLEDPAYNVLQYNSNDFTGLIEFNKKRSFEYSKQLQNNRILNEANTAWSKKDYASFIKLINKIDSFDLPNSYQLKLKIALKKSEN
jgi:hypothetical protein